MTLFQAPPQKCLKKISPPRGLNRGFTVWVKGSFFLAGVSVAVVTCYVKMMGASC